jgi:ribonucleoside-diphosphate reductase alpha chain
MFASGLVIEALRAFNENLWLACDTAMGIGMKLSQEDSEDLLKRDFVRRLNKFAVNFFDGNKEKATFCLKDCYNLHKWI